MAAGVRLAIDRLVQSEVSRIRGRRIGALLHPASVTGSLESSLSALLRAGAEVRALFGPEHGLEGEAQDMEPVGPDDTPRSIPAFSLYGSDFASLSPRPEWLDELDAVVIDLQDVGARYYTFVWTALLMARACASRGLEVLVCDRPNPLGGDFVQGSPQRMELQSFVGLRSVPVQHGLTLGELLLDAARDEGLANVSVIPLEGWTRAMRWSDTGLTWVSPSPNMPTPETAFVYPGGCLVEGTNLSEGRGTTRPFELVGAPWTRGSALADRLKRDGGPGLAARASRFRPMFHKHAGTTCDGVQVHVVEPRRFEAYRAYLAILAASADAPGFSWRTETYEFVDTHPAIDLLTGDPDVRAGLEAGAPIEDLLAVGSDRMDAWNRGLRDRWLYGR